MNKYENGKIYKIEAINGDEGDIYIGSTSQKLLCSRIAKHKHTYKQYNINKKKRIRSYDIFDKYGADNCVITLLEIVNCKTKDELLARERFYIQSLKCVNKNIPSRTKQEYNKQYKEIHRERYVENFACECGTICQVRRKSRHFQSKKHQDFLNQPK